MSIEVKGVPEVTRAIQKAAKAYPAGVGTALYKTGVSFLAEAIRRAPVDTGMLRRSGYVSLPYPKEKPRVELGFGTIYAGIQHEGNFKHPRGGERYYFRNAIDALMGRMAKAIPEWAKAAAKRDSDDTSSQFPRKPQIAPGAGQVKRKDVRARFSRGSSNTRSRTGG